MTVIFFQARFESSRLPGKMLKDFDINMNPLQLIASRFKYYAKQYDFPLENAHFLLPDTPKSEILASVIKNVSTKFHIFFGPSHNVLKRFQLNLKKMKRSSSSISHAARVCCDNPFIDFEAIFNDLNSDTINNSSVYFQRTIKRRPSTLSAVGLAYEIFDADHLLSLNTSMPRAEHVTLDLYEDCDSTYWMSQPSFEDLYGIIDERIRLTLDYKRDFEIINSLLFNSSLPWSISTPDLISFLNSQEAILETMAYNNFISDSKP